MEINVKIASIFYKIHLYQFVAMYDKDNMIYLLAFTIDISLYMM